MGELRRQCAERKRPPTPSAGLHVMRIVIIDVRDLTTYHPCWVTRDQEGT